MLPVERLDGVPAYARQIPTSGLHDIPKEVPELRSEPLAHRRLEATLAPPTDLRWQKVAERPAQDALAAYPADLPAARNTERKLDDAMVQERHPDLERVGHARNVDLGEHVPGEPEPAVRVQHSVDRVTVVRRDSRAISKHGTSDGSAKGSSRWSRAGSTAERTCARVKGISVCPLPICLTTCRLKRASSKTRSSGNVTENVRSGVGLAAAARMLTTEESMPPLRKAPTGTSATRCSRTAVMSKERSSSSAAALERGASPGCQTQYGRRSTPSRSATRSSPGARRCTSR